MAQHTQNRQQTLHYSLYELYTNAFRNQNNSSLPYLYITSIPPISTPDLVSVLCQPFTKQLMRGIRVLHFHAWSEVDVPIYSVDLLDIGFG